MSSFLAYTVFGLVLAAIYAVAASGLVVTYTTTGIFNFAHGAVGMLGAYAFWQLHVAWGLPIPLAVAIVLVVLAPALGVVVDRVIMRGLEDVSEVAKIVVPIGLLFALLSLAPMLWSPQRSYRAISFFGTDQIELFGVGVTYHQLICIAVAAAVALFLRVFLFGSRTGTSMRAVVDNRSLARLSGIRPERTSALSWALGCSLAALAGILIQERVGFNVLALTFLVVNAYSAAVVGRLVSLPMTFLGAVILGLAQAYAQGYIPQNPSWLPDGLDITTPLRLAIPVILLFIALLALPVAPLRTHGIARLRETVGRPAWRRSLLGFGALVVVVAVLTWVIPEADAIGWGKGLAYAIIMLSLVPLTGFGGQISLAQMSLAGIAAFTAAAVGADAPALGLLLGVVVATLVGALVALPALRLRGIYLALATLAFAYFVEKVVLTQRLFVPGTSRPVGRLALGPVALTTAKSYLVLLAVVFSLVGCVVIAVRRGPFGRRLLAMKDSPAACATLGINLTVTKLQVFMLSAAIAGLGGVLLAGVQQNAQVDDYSALANLPILLLAVGGGISLVSGALVGGVFYAALGVLGSKVPAFTIVGADGRVLVNDLLLLVPGLVGISLGRNPNGSVILAGQLARRVWARLGRAVPEMEGVEVAGATADGVGLESLGLSRAFTPADLAAIDAELGLDDESAAVYDERVAADRPALVRSVAGAR